MKRHLAVSAAALVAMAVASSALAKGPSEAVITGPGLDNGIELAGEGQVGGETLMRLAEDAGFFPAVFSTVPSPMLRTRPHSDLGPRYTITYAMPGSNGVVELRQDLYPYAKPDPVTYMERGLGFWDTERTVGGWYVATSALRDELVAVGLPETPPVEDGSGLSLPYGIVAIAVVMTALVVGVVGAVAARHRRRRPRHAPA